MRLPHAPTIAVVSLVALACTLPSPSAAQVQDVTPPVLTGFAFSPTAVNTTTGSATVNVTASATDDLSGVGSVSVTFSSPSGQHQSGSLQLSSGTVLNGTWTGSITFPQYGEPGTYAVAGVFLSDYVANTRLYSTSDLQALGFPTTLQVTSNQDVTPPVLIGFAFSPTAVNTTTGSATVNVTASATDDLSGVGSVSVTFSSPSGQHQSGSLQLSSGTVLNGTWTGSITFPQYGEPGTYAVAGVFLSDYVANTRLYSTSDLQALGFPTTLQVTSNQDVTPPVLTGFAFSPTAVNTTTGSATVNVTASATDNLSGVGSVSVTFSSPSGQHHTSGSLRLSSGTVLNGTWTGSIIFPQYGELGTYAVGGVFLSDYVANTRLYSTSDLQARGFPTQLVVQGGDNTPPTTTANSSPGPNVNGWNNTNVTVNLNATDNPGGSGVKQIQFALSGAQNTGWQTVGGDAASVTISAEGTTILSYFATDNAGNQETAKTLTVRIDKTLPVMSGLPAPGCTIWPPNHNLFQVATVTATDALSGLAPGSFNVTGTSNDPANGQIVIAGGPSQFSIQLGADKDEVYTLTATASDLAGNVATMQATCTVPHDQGK